MAKKNNINTDIFCELKVAEKSQVPVLFISNPGIGKTTSVYYFAKVRGYEVVLLRGNSTTAEEVMGYDVAPRDVTYDHKMAAINLRPSWFEEVLRNKEAGKKTLLFLDEITTANEFVQAALLHLIFERKVHTESIPEDTLIVSAGNYAQNLSNTMSLLPPVMNRFGIFNITPKINTAAGRVDDDLNIFLNKYEGSSIGRKKDYIKDLEKTMIELDKQELKISQDKLDRLGEYIEEAIKDAVRELVSTKAADLAVTDLQSIYADNSDGDTRLYGFISFRTLNYLRDTAIAYYQCFGKAGISSDNFKNSIIGLCGCSVVKNEKRTGDVKLNKQAWKEFYDRINARVSDFEKLNNDKLSEYEKFFRTYEGKDSITDAEANALSNKFEELIKDSEIVNIERPIEAKLISSICDSLKASALKLKGKKLVTGKSIEETIPCEELIKNVISWNYIANVFCSIITIVKDTNRKYDPSLDAYISGLIGMGTDFASVSTVLNGKRTLYLKRDASMGSIIPEVKVIKR